MASFKEGDGAGREAVGEPQGPLFIQRAVVYLEYLLHSMNFRHVFSLNGKMEEISHGDLSFFSFLSSKHEETAVSRNAAKLGQPRVFRAHILAISLCFMWLPALTSDKNSSFHGNITQRYGRFSFCFF